MGYQLITAWPWPREIAKPLYGWVHWIFLCAAIILTTLLSIFVARKHNKKHDDIVIFVLSCYLFISETYKIIFKVLYNGYFAVSTIPWQLSSIPLYIGLAIPFIKPGKVKEAMYGFIAYYGTIGGLVCLLWPNIQLGNGIITLLVQEMMWHVVLTAMGIYSLVARTELTKDWNWKNSVMWPSVIFVGCVIVALIGNFTIDALVVNNPDIGANQHINLFGIGANASIGIPFLETIRQNAYPVIPIVYTIALIGFATIIWSATILLRKLINKKVKPKEETISEETKEE